MAENIHSVDVLVHPDFHPIYCARTLDSFQQNLRQRWDARAAAIKEDRHSALLYLAAWQQTVPESRTEQEDLERTGRYQALLGNRLVVYLEPGQPTAEKVNASLATNGLAVANNPNINIYGEYQQLCVAAMFDAFGEIFPNGQRQVLKDLCRPK